MNHFRPAIVLLLLFTVLFGGIYPLAVTGIAQTAFPEQANGSLIRRDGQIVGSKLIGQSFNRADYFWPRPSAAGKGYDASASSGANLGPTSKVLVERVQTDAAKLRDAGVTDLIPADLLTTSGSGLDPDISPAAARVQIARVAKARNLTQTDVEALVAAHTDHPMLGFLGEPRVNVLELNLALDALKATGG